MGWLTSALEHQQIFLHYHLWMEEVQEKSTFNKMGENGVCKNKAGDICCLQHGVISKFGIKHNKEGSGLQTKFPYLITGYKKEAFMSFVL